MTYFRILMVYSFVVTLLVLVLAMQNRHLKRPPAPEAASLDTAVRHEFDFSGTPIIGAEDAAVTITVFSDFECPACAAAHPVVDSLVDDYSGQVNMAFKHFPLGYHPNARTAAAASMAAHGQGKFKAMHDALFQIHSELSSENIDAVAQSIGLDMTMFSEVKDEARWHELIERDREEALRAGVRGTPSFFVNGVQIKPASRGSLEAAIRYFLEEDDRVERVAQR